MVRREHHITVLLALLIVSAVAGISCGRAEADAAPAVGRVAPSLSLRDVSGRVRSLAEFRGRPVVVCFLCGCAACHEFASEWGRLQSVGGDVSSDRPSSPVTIVVYLGTAQALRSFAAETGLEPGKTVLLTDADGRATRSYDALPCPRLFILDSSRIVRFTNNYADDAPQRATGMAIATHVAQALGKLKAPAPDTVVPQGLTDAGTTDRAGGTGRREGAPAPLTIAAQPGLRVVSEGARLDFGFIDRLEAPTSERDVALRNHGATAVVIDRVVPSCACLTAAIVQEGTSAAARTLKPGQAMTLRLVLDVSQQTPGPLQKYVWIMEKGRSVPAFAIEVDATTEASVRCDPDLLEFGSVRAGAQRTLPFTIMIDSRLARNGLPPELACTNPNIIIAVVGKAAHSAGSGGRDYLVQAYSATLSPNAPIGVLAGSVTFSRFRKQGADSMSAKAAVPGDLSSTVAGAISLGIRGEIIGEISANPSAIRFDVVHPGRDRPKQIALIGPLLTGLTVSCDADWLSARLLPGAAAAQPTRRILEVAVRPSAPAGPVRAQITITTATGKRVVVPVTGYVVPGTNH